MSLAICKPLGCRMFSEMPRLPAFLLLNWPPISGSRTPGSGPVAASRAARPPTGAIAASRVSGLSFHSTLKHLRAHCREKPRAPGRGEEPCEIEDFYALQRERLVVQCS